VCKTHFQACLDCRIFILHAFYSWNFAPRRLEVALELPLYMMSLEKFVLPFVIVSSSRFDLCDHLSEETVERDPTLYELLNKDIEFFVNPSLGIKILCLLCSLCLLTLLLLFTFLMSLTCGRSSLLS
jgi:hypothetical protein